MSSELVRCYELYYSNPYRYANDLYHAIINYDFQGYPDSMAEINLIKSAYLTSNDSIYIRSNGTTFSTDVRYSIGPMFGFWCPAIEKHLRGFDIEVLFSYGSVIDDSSSYCRPMVGQGRDKNKYIISFDIMSEANRIDVLAILSRLSERHNCRLSIAGVPTLWVLISTDSEIKNHIRTYLPYIKSFINIDWESWVSESFLRDFFLNDQMIDWRTGLNFYTCAAGELHFLPIFHIGTDGLCSNLLNLSIMSEVSSDTWMDYGTILCKCNRVRRAIKFCSKPDLNFDFPRHVINDFESGYLNLQFLRDDSGTKVLYKTSNQFRDQQLLYDIIGDHVSIQSDQHFFIGRKKVNFFSTRGRVIDITSMNSRRCRNVNML